MAAMFQIFAKSYITLGKWSSPKPLGHTLEIVPLTDMSNLRVGDLVEVEVRFLGKPLNTTFQTPVYIVASGANFGQEEMYSLHSYLVQDKARFRVQSKGQWIINIVHQQAVTNNGPLKDIHGKADQVYYGASLTFNVR
jgi:uncharacterized GH25 family protein